MSISSKAIKKEVLLELFKISLDKNGAGHAKFAETVLETFKRAELGSAKSAPLSPPRMTQSKGTGSESLGT
jgi:hypothetical protein